MSFLTFLAGYKTYLAALGLFGLAMYQVSIDQYDQAMQSFLAALAAIGLRGAIAKVNPTPTPTPAPLVTRRSTPDL